MTSKKLAANKPVKASGRKPRPFEYYFEKAQDFLCKKITWNLGDIYVNPFYGFNEVSVEWTDTHGREHTSILFLNNTTEGDGE